MHLIERYSLSTGLKIDNPNIQIKYFPLSVKEYICIDASANCESKKYDKWDIVIELLKSQNLKAKIVQIGSSNDQDLGCDIDLRGKLNSGQQAYIIKSAQAVLCVDNLSAHLGAYFNVPLVSIYSNTYSQCTRPYWGHADTKLIEAFEKLNLLPSFSVNESPKTLNHLNPETIANSLTGILSLKEVNFETVFVGNRFREQCVDVIPDTIYGSFNQKINVRLDKNFDEKSLISLLQNNKCEITTTKPINDQLLSKDRISLINYITDEFDQQFIKNCESRAIPIILLCTSKEKISKQRASLFDHKIHEYSVQSIIESNKKIFRNIDPKEAKIKSNKKIISLNKEYQSYYEYGNFSNQDDFYVDLEWYYVYRD